MSERDGGSGGADEQTLLARRRRRSRRAMRVPLDEVPRPSAGGGTGGTTGPSVDAAAGGADGPVVEPIEHETDPGRSGDVSDPLASISIEVPVDDLEDRPTLDELPLDTLEERVPASEEVEEAGPAGEASAASGDDEARRPSHVETEEFEVPAGSVDEAASAASADTGPVSATEQAVDAPPVSTEDGAGTPPPAGEEEAETLDLEEVEAVADASPPAAAPPPPPRTSGPPTPPASPPQPPPAARPAPRRRAWFEEYFDDDYLRTVLPPPARAIARQCDFVMAALGLEEGARVLDVGCGLGLHAIELARRGLQVVAMDVSLAMLARAAEEAQDAGVRINFLHADMREMAFEETFDAVLCLGTTFGYFDDETNGRVLGRFQRALRPGGRLLLDVVNRDHVLAAQPNLVWFEGDGCVCMEETDFNFLTSRLVVKRTLSFDDGRQRLAYSSVRLYALHELGQLMHQHGFRVTSVSGGEATPGVFLGTVSPRILMVAVRPGGGATQGEGREPETGKPSPPPPPPTVPGDEPAFEQEAPADPSPSSDEGG